MEIDRWKRDGGGFYSICMAFLSAHISSYGCMDKWEEGNIIMRIGERVKWDSSNRRAQHWAGSALDAHKWG